MLYDIIFINLYVPLYYYLYLKSHWKIARESWMKILGDFYVKRDLFKEQTMRLIIQLFLKTDEIYVVLNILKCV